MLTTTQPAAIIIAELLAKYGVRNVVASPGTRNAPLIVAFSRQSEFKMHSVVDERVAGFVALGMALRTSMPVALICTSGSALLNYAPAMAEAFYKGVPLIMISADRPYRWIDQDDGQTIRQRDVLSNVTRASFDITSDINSEDFPTYVNRIVNQALRMADGPKKGPVHINVQFDAPLGELSDMTDDLEKSLNIRLIKNIYPPKKLPHNEALELIKPIADKKVLIVVGTQSPDAKLNKSLKILSGNPNVAVFCEAQSNVKGVSDAVTSPDIAVASLTDSEKKEFAPDIVISVGGSVVSQNLKSWLRNSSDLQHWYIGTAVDKGFVDCYLHLVMNLEVEASSFLSQVAGVLRRYSNLDTGYKAFWKQKSENIKKKIRLYVTSAPWSDFVAVDTIINRLPANVNLHISNGMSIRYAQLCNYSRLHRIDCNRGVSGIDGSTSTAVGAAIDCPRPTVLITGDMSLDYDLSVLRSGLVPTNFSVFVINNRGGDIFRVIKNTRHLDEVESRMAVSHNRDYKELSEVFGFNYFHASEAAELKDLIKNEFFEMTNRNKPVFVEIDTRNSQNALVYHQFLQQINHETKMFQK